MLPVRHAVDHIGKCNQTMNYADFELRSTLTYNRELNTFNHYDSSSPSNHQSAKQCAAKLTPFVTGNSLFHISFFSSFLGTDTNVPFVEVSCPRQHNS